MIMHHVKSEGWRNAVLGESTMCNSAQSKVKEATPISRPNLSFRAGVASELVE